MRSRALLIVGVLAASLSVAGSDAPSQGPIMIRTADSGSHLRLAIRGTQLLVHGHMARTQPVGCRFSRGRSAATCALRSASAVVVEMGPSDDKIEVLDPLPVPLTAYLGSGSDKLIGNAEADQTSAGSDGCWGGPGPDVCRMGRGQDGCHGEAGDDRLYGGPAGDQLYGGKGSDYCDGGPGVGYSHHCESGPRH